MDVTANADFLREGLRVLVQAFIELEISCVIEATPHERSSNRRSYRNGYRRRTWMTSLGELTLEIPKLRKGSYYPAFLDTLRQSESFLLESLRKVYKNGVTVTDVEKIVDVMGFTQSQPDQIADIVEQLFDLVDRFRERPRMRLPDNLVLYRPVNAIATQTVDVRRVDDLLPKSLYAAYPDDWLTESLSVLIRVHRALSDEAAAVAA
jgi:hypothetical protein